MANFSSINKLARGPALLQIIDKLDHLALFEAYFISIGRIVRKNSTVKFDFFFRLDRWRWRGLGLKEKGNLYAKTRSHF